MYNFCQAELASGQRANPAALQTTAFVLVIEAPDDVVTAVAATEDAATKELYGYVRKHWFAPTQIPSNNDDAIDQFFSAGQYEYEIREQPLIR